MARTPSVNSSRQSSRPAGSSVPSWRPLGISAAALQPGPGRPVLRGGLEAASPERRGPVHLPDLVAGGRLLEEGAGRHLGLAQRRRVGVEDLVDRLGLVLPLDPDPVDEPDRPVGRVGQAMEGLLGDEERGAVAARQLLQARGQVDGVAHHRPLQPPLAAHRAQHDHAGVEPHADADARAPLAAAGGVEALQRAEHVDGRRHRVVRTVREEGQDGVAQVLLHEAVVARHGRLQDAQEGVDEAEGVARAHPLAAGGEAHHVGEEDGHPPLDGVAQGQVGDGPGLQQFDQGVRHEAVGRRLGADQRGARPLVRRPLLLERGHERADSERPGQRGGHRPRLRPHDSAFGRGCRWPGGAGVAGGRGRPRISRAAPPWRGPSRAPGPGRGRR